MSKVKEKHAGGRPPLYSAAEEMQKNIEAFFLECEEKKKPTTVAGLAIACGFTSRNQLYEYEKKEEFKDTIKRARIRIECEVETRLFGNNSTGSIFWLKNHADYRDKTETELTGKDGAALNPYSELELANRIATLLMKAKKAKAER